jgi:hypothetical protein
MRLTVTNLTNSSISVGGRVGKLPAGISTTTTLDLTVDELEKVQSRLVALKAAGVILFTVAANADTNDNPTEGVTVQYMQDYVTTALAGVSGGGGGGPTYIVGNSAAGDTSSNCTHLDSGNGDALRTALAAAGGTGGSVFVRRGTYTLTHAGGATVVPGNVDLIGEGQGTVLALPRSGEIFSLDINGRVENCAIRQTGQPNGAFAFSTNRFIEMRGGARLNKCLVEILANGGSAGNYGGFYSMVRMSSALGLVSNCVFRGYSSTTLGAGFECLGVQAIGGFCGVVDSTFGDTGFNAFDVPVELGEASYNYAKGCNFVRTTIHGVRLVMVFDTQGQRIEGCNFDVRGGNGVGIEWFGNGVLRNTLIHGNVISCAATASHGINLFSTSGTNEIDFLSIQNNMLVGAGAGIGIRLAESGGGLNSNVNESLNSVYNFGTARSIAATGGGLTQVGNLP